MIIPSERTKKRIIEREGARWGLVPMFLDDGRCLVAEKIPVFIPGPGVSYVDVLVRDITAISNSYPWGKFLWTRKRKGEREFYARVEMAKAARKKEREWRIEDTKAAMRDDLRAAGRIILPVTR